MERNKKMGIAILFGTFLLSIIIGMPIAFGIGVASFLTILYEDINPVIAFQRIIAGINVYSLVAVPFFIFAGELMLHGRIAERLVQFSTALFGRIRGGLGIVNIFSSMLFGGISGSAVADTSAVGAIMIPMMKEKNYDADYAVNVTVTSSIAGVLIPPSHNMILFSLAAGGSASVAALFLGGLLPGILICIGLAIVAYIVARRRGYASEDFPGMQALLIFGMRAIPGAITGVIIVGGVLGGIFTVTEAAAVGVVYALVISVLAMRTVGLKEGARALRNATRTTAMVMMLVGTSSIFGYLMAWYKVPELAMSLMLSASDNPIFVLLLMNLTLLVLGMIMDMAPLILICTPIFLPIATAMGMDPTHFGVMLMLNLGIGLVTPPVGVCLFVGCVIGKIPMEKTVRTILPFYFVLFLLLMLVTFVPQLSMSVPNWLGL